MTAPGLTRPAQRRPRGPLSRLRRFYPWLPQSRRVVSLCRLGSSRVPLRRALLRHRHDCACSRWPMGAFGSRVFGSSPLPRVSLPPVGRRSLWFVRGVVCSSFPDPASSSGPRRVAAGPPSSRVVRTCPLRHRCQLSEIGCVPRGPSPPPGSRRATDDERIACHTWFVKRETWASVTSCAASGYVTARSCKTGHFGRIGVFRQTEGQNTTITTA